MNLWQKEVTPQWLVSNEPLLEKIAGSDLAGISRPGKLRSLVQRVCRRRAKIENLIREFGGVVRPLARDWSKTAQSNQAHTPIRISRRLEIVGQRTPSPTTSSITQLIVPAAGAFGTGEHATTALWLRLLEEIAR